MEHVPGTPQSPMSEAEHQNKFLECTSSGSRPLSRAKSMLIARRVKAIENVADMALFFDDVI